jgi:hypothetical protein
MLGGTLIRLSPSDFQQLDPDWAIASRPNSSPVVFKIRVEDPGPSFNFKVAGTKQAIRALLHHRMRQMEEVSQQGLNTAMLIYYCILAVTADEYPDPRIGSYYVRRGDEVNSWGGILGGNTYLNLDRCPVLGAETVSKIARTAALWQAKGLAHSNPVFGPLRALSLSRSASLSKESATLTLVVALEGYVLGMKTVGIAAAIAKNCRKLLGSTAPANIESLVKEVYALRSDIVHGRSQDSALTSRTYKGFRRLAADVVLAAVERVIGMDRIMDPLVGIHEHLLKA